MKPTQFEDAAPGRADDELNALRLAALAHPARLTILRELSNRPFCCVKAIVPRLGLAQSTVSQHLKILVNAGLVTFSTDRQSSRYSLDREAIAALSAEIQDILGRCCGGACCASDKE